MSENKIFIKPCPFCGKTPKITVNLSDMYCIECSNDACYVKPSTRPITLTKEELIEKWNLRIGCSKCD